MTPEQKIKCEILMQARSNGESNWQGDNNTLDEYWDRLVEEELHWEYISDFRTSGIETGLPSDYSRHYECKEVARQLHDGTWIGWTYWYGGGKHGNPEGVGWMPFAYELICREEEKLVTVRTFSKAKQ